MANDNRNSNIASSSKGSRKLPFTMKNYLLFAAGIVAIIIGYFLMSIGPHDSVYSLTISPVVLLIGYIVLLPMSVLMKFNK